MYIESVPNRNSPAAVLLRESYREDGKVRKRTLANLSCLTAEVIEGLKVLLRGGVAVPSAEAVFTVERSLPHGHVAAVLGAARGSGCPAWFGSAPQDLQPVLQAMLVARLLEPASKLATHRSLHDDTATSSLGRVLGVGQCSVDDLYRALDWLVEAQPGIERRLARQHLLGGTLVLYDLTSTWLTGRCCALAARGHSRHHVGRRDQVFGAELLHVALDHAAPRGQFAAAELGAQRRQLLGNDRRHAVWLGQDVEQVGNLRHHFFVLADDLVLLQAGKAL